MRPIKLHLLGHMAIITLQVGIKLFLRLPALLDFSWLDFIFLTKAIHWSAPIVMLLTQIWRGRGKKLNHTRWQTDRKTTHDSGPWDRKPGRLRGVGTLLKKLVVGSVVPSSQGERPWSWLVIWPPKILAEKIMLGGRDSRVFCLLLWQTLWNSIPQAVALSGFEVEFCLWRMLHFFLQFLKYRRLFSFTKKFGCQMEHKRFDG